MRATVRTAGTRQRRPANRRPEFQASVSADEGAEAASAKEQRRRELLFHLHESGQYFAFKEKLKRSVVKLARESLRRDSAKEPDAAEVARFHNELYVSLTMRMNRALDGVFDDARALSPQALQELMGVSDSIAALNHARFMNWHPEFTLDNAKQAVHTDGRSPFDDTHGGGDRGVVAAGSAGGERAYSGAAPMCRGPAASGQPTR